MQIKGLRISTRFCSLKGVGLCSAFCAFSKPFNKVTFLCDSCYRWIKTIQWKYFCVNEFVLWADLTIWRISLSQRLTKNVSTSIPDTSWKFQKLYGMDQMRLFQETRRHFGVRVLQRVLWTWINGKNLVNTNVWYVVYFLSVYVILAVNKVITLPTASEYSHSHLFSCVTLKRVLIGVNITTSYKQLS